MSLSTLLQRMVSEILLGSKVPLNLLFVFYPPVESGQTLKELVKCHIEEVSLILSIHFTSHLHIGYHLYPY